jgi:peptidoglycan-associated lipoprotein
VDVDVDVDVDDPAPTAVRFATVGGTTVGPESNDALDAIVARMKKTHHRVVVEGHADARGSRRVNLDVSKRRAQAVAQALIARGADPKQVEVRWFGERKPAVVGEGDAAWAANRRAEIEWRGNE